MVTVLGDALLMKRQNNCLTGGKWSGLHRLLFLPGNMIENYSPKGTNNTTQHSQRWCMHLLGRQLGNIQRNTALILKKSISYH